MNSNSKFIIVAAAIIAVSLIVSLVGIFNGWMLSIVQQWDDHTKHKIFGFASSDNEGEEIK